MLEPVFDHVAAEIELATCLAHAGYIVGRTERWPAGTCLCVRIPGSHWFLPDQEPRPVQFSVYLDHGRGLRFFCPDTDDHPCFRDVQDFLSFLEKWTASLGIFTTHASSIFINPRAVVRATRA